MLHQPEQANHSSNGGQWHKKLTITLPRITNACLLLYKLIATTTKKHGMRRNEILVPPKIHIIHPCTGNGSSEKFTCKMLAAFRTWNRHEIGRRTGKSGARKHIARTFLPRYSSANTQLHKSRIKIAQSRNNSYKQRSVTKNYVIWLASVILTLRQQETERYKVHLLWKTSNFSMLT